MKLIDTLGRQIGGRSDWQGTEPGTRFALEFFVKKRPVP